MRDPGKDLSPAAAPTQTSQVEPSIPWANGLGPDVNPGLLRWKMQGRRERNQSPGSINIPEIGAVDPDGPTNSELEKDEEARRQFEIAHGRDPDNIKIDPVNYKVQVESFAANAAVPMAPMPQAALYVPPTPPMKMPTGNSIPSMIPGVAPQPEMKSVKVTPYQEACWAAYADACQQTVGIWNGAIGSLDQYFISSKETAHELQDEVGLPVRSTKIGAIAKTAETGQQDSEPNSIAKTVDDAGQGGKGAALQDGDALALAQTGRNQEVKIATDVLQAAISSTQSAYGQTKTAVAEVNAAGKALEQAQSLADLAKLEAEEDKDKAAVTEAKGLAGELKGNISTILSIGQAFVAAAGGNLVPGGKMIAETAYDEMLNAIYWKEVEAANKALKATAGKIAALKGKLPGIQLDIATFNVDASLGKAQTARGALKKALIEQRQQFDRVAELIEKHHKGKNPGDAKRLAAAVRALPKAQLVASMAKSCTGPLSVGIPYTQNAGIGYAMAQKAGDPSALDLIKVAGWIVATRAKMKAEESDWTARVGNLQQILNALQDKE